VAFFIAIIEKLAPLPLHPIYPNLLIDFEPGKENYDNLMAAYDLIETY
jgi:hypothetical protein